MLTTRLPPRDMAKILVAEDDRQLAELMQRALAADRHTIDLVYDGSEAEQMIKAFFYDLIIVDWGLPGMTGYELLKQLRSQGKDIPVLMVTGKGSLADKEMGFEGGVDDYLTKPFQIKELVFRARALLRRAAPVKGSHLQCGALKLDTKTHSATLNGVQLKLQPKEFKLLEFFMKHPGEVFSPEALIQRVWPSDSEVYPNAVRTLVKKLRKRLDLDPADSFIETVFGVGYKFVEPGVD